MTMVQQGEEMTKITFKIPKSLSKEIAIYGINYEVSAQQIFNDAIKDWVEKHIPKDVARKSSTTSES